ncbi:SDR family NAD(P)-dependent oxidoreductase [Nocardia niigatensis]|uniref:SDR family NAD(P)-dependent oxidoreductase n=1 Tax=Nocardia niigatensis TaxID=209249 RepID=UPI0003001572|nr:SDR family NAD(P)-dependent oxidoreductase [Nocardia niigatensis]
MTLIHPHQPEYVEPAMAELAGTVAVVTGADSATGRALAIAFARAGADVVIEYKNQPQQAAWTRRRVLECGHRAVLVQGDLNDTAHCYAVIDAALREFGKIDIFASTRPPLP